MTQNKLRYSEFWHRINVDAFEDAIGFSPVEERNGNDIGYCLWPENHANGDTTGKFGILREECLYNCYVCGGGDFLSLAMELHDFDIDEATSWLYQFCEEDTRSDNEFLDDFLASFEDVDQRIKTLPYFNPRVLEKFEEPIPDWWKSERYIDDDTLAKYGIRYVSEMRRNAPPRGRHAEADDYIGPAIIFPHFWKERLVGWQARWLNDDRPEWVPKYTNTTDFPKDSTIYGYDQALKADGPVIVIESVPSALFCITMFRPAVATFGSNVNPAQMRLLRRFSNGVILAHDNDKPKGEGKSAGEKWRDSLTEYLKRYIPVWNLPPVKGESGSDLGDIASYEYPDNEFYMHLDRAYQPGIDL